MTAPSTESPSASPPPVASPCSDSSLSSASSPPRSPRPSSPRHSVDSLLAQASFLCSRGRHTAASKTVTTALSLLNPDEPQYPPALVQLAAVHVAHARFLDAEDTLRRALRVAPDFVPALQALATMLSKNPVHLREALQLLRQAVSLASSCEAPGFCADSLSLQLAALLTDVSYNFV